MAIHTWPLNLKLDVQNVQIATLDIRVGLFILGHFTSQNRISKKIGKIQNPKFLDFETLFAPLEVIDRS